MRLRRQNIFISGVMSISTLWFVGCADTSTYDVIIENGTIVDGTGKAAYRSDVGIRDEIIAKIGNLSQAETAKRIDATDLVVAPGFIDAHSHANHGLRDPELSANEGFLKQGVTTCIFGVDGASTPSAIKVQIEIFEQQGAGTNYAFYVGHNGIRQAVMGMENREPTLEELEQMKAMVKEGMEMGALGLSTGIMYLPGRYAKTEEVIELAKVIAPYEGVYDSHIRDPANDLVASVKECIEIGEKSGSRPHPAHHKAPGMKNWGKAKEISDYIKAAIERGVDVTVDQYPYDGAATGLLFGVFVLPEGISRDDLLDALRDTEKRKAIQEITENPPPEVYSWVETVGYDSFRIVASEKFPEYVGKMLVDIAQEKGIDSFTMMVEIVREDGGLGTIITYGACSEDDVRYIMTRPWTMISSDGSINTGRGGGHPRSYGTFPRILGRYVREWKVLSLEEAVHKMTGLTARYFKLQGLGKIKKGYQADITVFDPESVIDRSDWIHPNELAEGIIHVLVNGAFTLENGEVTGNLNGRFVPFKDGEYIK